MSSQLKDVVEHLIWGNEAPIIEIVMADFREGFETLLTDDEQEDYCSRWVTLYTGAKAAHTVQIGPDQITVERTRRLKIIFERGEQHVVCALNGNEHFKLRQAILTRLVLNRPKVAYLFPDGCREMTIGGGRMVVKTEDRQQMIFKLSPDEASALIRALDRV